MALTKEDIINAVSDMSVMEVVELGISGSKSNQNKGKPFILKNQLCYHPD